MPTPDEIAKSIDERLLQAAEEIRQLEAARQALSGIAQAPASRTPARRVTRSAGVSRTDRTPANRPTAAARTRRRTATIDPEQIQTTLRSATDGLSAADIAEQTGAERPRLLTLLRQLEASGDVRRSGERRTTRWHLVTDEDRIAQRAAELAALS